MNNVCNYEFYITTFVTGATRLNIAKPLQSIEVLPKP